MQQLYVFGYGSLMNPKSLARTVPGEKIATRGTLSGYQRRMNVRYGDFLYLNIVPREDAQVAGAIIPVTSDELEMLKRRENMYACVDITSKITPAIDGIVYAFIAPDVAIPVLKVPRSYIRTCLDGVPAEERDTWISETIFDGGIEEDETAPVYENTPEE